VQAKKKANLNRASLKWETQFKKEGKWLLISKVQN
jgi:hypothetical protein